MKRRTELPAAAVLVAALLAPAAAAHPNRPPSLSAITVRTAGEETTFSVRAEDPDSQPQIFWVVAAGGECGSFEDSNTPTFRWNHADCPHPPQVHAATVEILVTDGELECNASYQGGSAPGMSRKARCDGAHQLAGGGAAPSGDGGMPAWGWAAIALATLGAVGAAAFGLPKLVGRAETES